MYKLDRFKCQMQNPFAIQFSELFAMTAALKQHWLKPLSPPILLISLPWTGAFACRSAGRQSHLHDNARPSYCDVCYKASCCSLPCFSLKQFTVNNGANSAFVILANEHQVAVVHRHCGEIAKLGGMRRRRHNDHGIARTPSMRLSGPRKLKNVF